MGSLFSRDDMSLKIAVLLVLGVFLNEAAGVIEGRFFPVVKDVRVTRIDAAENGRSRIWGQFNLTRAGCDFHDVEWELVGAKRSVLASVEFEEGAKERGDGLQEFGSWLVQLTPDQLKERSRAIVYHECPWRWWRTETHFYP